MDITIAIAIEILLILIFYILAESFRIWNNGICKESGEPGYILMVPELMIEGIRKGKEIVYRFLLIWQKN